jgi:hypothetical protein
MKVTKDVLIGFPCYDNKTEVQILEEIFAGIQDPQCPIASVQYYNGDSLIPRGRNKIVKMFMDSPYKYLMFIDSDIMFKRSMITKLRNHNKGIVGGVYLKKTLPYTPVLNNFLGDEGELSIMREIGTGFMMIRKDVFGAISAYYPEHAYRADDDEPKEGHPYYDYFRVGVSEGRYLSEDWFFCHIAGTLGYKSYVDKSILVNHIGRMVYPTQDNQLLSGAGELLHNIPQGHELSQDVLRRMKSGVERHIKPEVTYEPLGAPEPVTDEK